MTVLFLIFSRCFTDTEMLSMHVSFTARGGGRRAKAVAIGIALENIYVALTAVKDHTLFQHGNALQLLRMSASNASLKAKLYVKTDGNRIKTAIELD